MGNYKFHLLVFVGLILLNFVLFGFNLKDFFLSDDFDWLTIAKTSEHSLIDYFTANYYGERKVGGSYRPMINLVFWLNYKIGGLNSLSYHLTNLLFHMGVCFLIYLLVLVLFEEFKEKNKIAFLSALFFSILPNHSEAVIWIAGVADPVATFFYLLSFYFYILFRKREKFYFLLISFIGFILALLTKEIAITLPLLILVWEFYEAIFKNKFKARNIFLYTLGYWLLTIGYLLLRFASIGLFFGYYAQEKFKINLDAIFKMFISLLTDLLFYGKLRVFLTNFFAGNKIFFIFLFILILILIWRALKNYKFKPLFLFDSYFILILPVLFLNFNNFTDEGERYNYLPSIVFCILLSLLFLQIKKNKLLKIIILWSLLFYFSYFLIYKNENWQTASQISKKIIFNDFGQVVDLNKKDEKLLFVALPDNFEGAPIFRNGIKLAINLYYPDYKLEGIVLNSYVRLTKKNWNQQILKWADYPTGGYIAKTIDGRYWVTGFDRRETENYIFELWNYNYDNYNSDTIRLILKNEKGEFIKAGEENVNILIFDQGKLKSLNK